VGKQVSKYLSFNDSRWVIISRFQKPRNGFAPTLDNRQIRPMRRVLNLNFISRDRSSCLGGRRCGLVGRGRTTCLRGVGTRKGLCGFQKSGTVMVVQLSRLFLKAVQSIVFRFKGEIFTDNTSLFVDDSRGRIRSSHLATKCWVPKNDKEVQNNEPGRSQTAKHWQPIAERASE
jgi:hypothetical protein